MVLYTIALQEAVCCKDIQEVLAEIVRTFYFVVGALSNDLNSKHLCDYERLLPIYSLKQ